MNGVVLGSEEYSTLVASMKLRLGSAGDDYTWAQGDDEMFTPERVQLAVEDALQDWNSLPPPIGIATLRDHPAPGLLRVRTLALLLRSQADRLALRGQDFSDGGASISDTTKSQLLANLSNTYNAEYQSQAQATKKALNAQQGWGASPSEYSYVGCYDDYGCDNYY